MNKLSDLDMPETAGIFKKLNAEQAAAVTAACNSVVAAGAGSGKTTVLASRFAYLVLYRDIPAEKILTLTFTKKAAAEMYARIYKTLKTVSEHGSGSIQLKAQAAVDSFFKVHIQTLDSYSTAIVKLAAHRYGIKPDFETDNEACLNTARAQALQFLLEHRSQDALRLFLRSARAEQLAQELFADTVCAFSRISDPPAFERSLQDQFAVLINDWCRKTQQFETQLDAIQAAFIQKPASTDTEKKIDSFVRTYYEKTAALLPGEKELAQYTAAILASAQGSRCTAAEISPVQSKLTGWLTDVLAGLQIRKSGSHEAVSIFKEAAAAAERLGSIAALLLQAGLSADIMPLLDTFQSRFLEWKRTSGKLTFDDVAALAVDILKNETDIRRNEKHAFDAIMIDEFQDNNSIQRDMLLLLAEKHDRCVPGIPSAQDICPDKLFFVGDEKQSIYRFRGADVSVFRSLTETLPSTQMLRLRCNYRSEPALIRAANIMFSGKAEDAEPAASAVVPQTAAPFSAVLLSAVPSIFLSADIPEFPEYEAACFPAVIPDGITPAEQPAEAQNVPRVHVCILDKAEADEEENTDTDSGASAQAAAASPSPGSELSSAENEAVFTAKKIHDLTAAADAPYKAQDCAILLRSYSKQIFFEKALREAGIPYVTENIVSFFSDAPVNDILHLIRLLAYPADVLSYAAVLASPFAGLSPKGIAVCIHSYTESAAQDGIQTQLPFSEAADALLGGQDAAAYCAARTLYRRLIEQTQTVSAADIITELWYAEGYRYETLWSSSTSLYRELYDYLYELARRSDEKGFSLADFADDLYRLRQDGRRLEDMEIPLDRPPAVRIMSIHKSKGLQFPVVFICDTAAKTGGNIGSDYISRIPLERDGQGSMVLKPPVPAQLRRMNNISCDYFTQKFRALQNAKEHAELRRLFYVALTRAEKEVFITAALDLKIEKTAEESLEQAIVRYTAEKMEAQPDKDTKNGTDSLVSFSRDTVLHNGTGIGLILPVIAGWIRDPARLPLFGLEQIPLQNRLQARNMLKAMHVRKNAAYTKRDIQLKALPLYERCTGEMLILEPPAVCSRLTPSTLETRYTGRTGLFVPEAVLPEAQDFADADAIAEKFRLPAQKDGAAGTPLFTAADLGTIAHAYIESSISGKPFTMEARIAAVLTPRQQQIITGAAQRMAERFMSSPLGQSVRNAVRKESEYPFRSRIAVSGSPVFIDGSIDLLFYGQLPQPAPPEPQLCVVDFKTDSEIRPERHIAQLACYRKAALDISGKTECRCIVYYLRFGYAADITLQAKEFNITAAAAEAAGSGMPAVYHTNN